MKCWKLPLFLILFVLCSCNNYKDVNIILSNIEKTINDNPKNALEELRKIENSNEFPKKIRAKYALLYSIALDKNYIDISSDSIINVALDYYKNRRLSTYRMKSYYYKGRVSYNAKLYPQANIYFNLAEKDAIDLSDHMYLGLIYGEMMRVFNISYNFKEALSYALKSNKSYQESKSIAHIMYSLNDIGISYFNQKNFTKALLFFNKALEKALEQKDSYLEYECRLGIASAFARGGNSIEANRQLLYIRDSLKLPLDFDWYNNYIVANTKNNQLDTAQRYVQYLYNTVQKDDPLFQKVKYKSYIVNKKLGDFKSALEEYEDVVRCQDSLVRSSLEESVIAYQRDYLKMQNDYIIYKYNSYIKIFIVLLFGMIMFVILLIMQKKMKALEVENYMSKILELERYLNNRSKQVTEMSLLARKLFTNKFSLINKLSETYYERMNTSNEQISLYKEVKKNIEKFSQSEYIKLELEEIINECRNDIMKRMREQLKSFKEQDFQLISYIIAGFSYQAISVFMGVKVENLYKRMYRLKERIIKLNPPDKDLFINELK